MAWFKKFLGSALTVSAIYQILKINESIIDMFKTVLEKDIQKIDTVAELNGYKMEMIEKIKKIENEKYLLYVQNMSLKDELDKLKSVSVQESV